MSREAATRPEAFTRSKPSGDSGGLLSRESSKFAAPGLMGLSALLVSCGGGVGAGESQPTVLESAPPASEASPTAPAVEEESGGSSEPSQEESEDAEPVPASSEGPAQNWSEPEIPEAIYEPTEEGAEALIQYWFDARHHARITGDVGPWEYVAHPDCEVCPGLIERVTEVYPQGWFIQEKADQVSDSYIRLEDESEVSGLFVLRNAAFEAFWHNELDSSNSGGTETVFGFSFVYGDGRWQASDFSFLGDVDEVDIEEGELADD